MKNGNRVIELDVAKGIGVFLVIIGHLGSVLPMFGRAWIYSFHMPLFFFASGFFAKHVCDVKVLMTRCKNKIIRLMGAYYLFLLSFAGIDIVIGYQTFTMEQVVSSLLGTDPFGGLWFLYALCFISLAFEIVIYICKGKNVMVIAITIILVLAGYILGVVDVLPRLGSILYGIGFYALGYGYKNLKCNVLMQKTKGLFVSALALSLVGAYTMFGMTGFKEITLDIHHNYSIDVLLNYIVASGGIILVLVVSKWFGSKQIGKILAFVGENSLIFYTIVSFLPARLDYLLRVEGNVAKLLTKAVAFVICIIISLGYKERIKE